MHAEDALRSSLSSLGVIDNISGTKILHDFAGNEYLFARFAQKGYGIYNFSNDDVVELSPFGKVPFSWDNSDVRYLPWVGFYEQNGPHYQNSRTNQFLSSSEQNALVRQSSTFIQQAVLDRKNKDLETNSIATKAPRKSATRHPVSDGFVYADHEIPYSWYFKENVDHYPKNITGDCGYVACSMLLAYMEIYRCTGYFTPEESKKYITPYHGKKVLRDEGFVFDGVPDLADNFPTDIWGQDIGGSVPSTIDKAIHKFLRDEGKNVKYHNYNFVWEFSSAKTPIKDGFPAAYFGNYENIDEPGSFGNHVTVVYGYFDDGRLLCNYGWQEDDSQVIMSDLGMFKKGGVVAIYNESSHVHNRYFFDDYNGAVYCGCGRLMSC